MAATGLDYLSAPGNDFDGYLVVARAATVDDGGTPGGNDVILVNPINGALQILIENGLGAGIVTDVIVDPFGDLVICATSGQSENSAGQLTHISVASDEGSDGNIVAGEVIGIDFTSPSVVFGATTSAAPAAGTNFNGFDIQTADTTTEAFVGDLIKLDGSTTTVGFSVTNNSGKDSGLTGVDGSVGPAPFDDPSIALDNYGAANVGNLSLIHI